MDDADRRAAAPRMTRGWRRIARSTRRHAGRFVLVLRVYVLLVVMRGVIATLSLPRITRHLGTPMAETPTQGMPARQLHYAHRVAWAIARAAPRTPTNSNCYPQALTAWWILHRRRIPTTVYYGAAFDDDRTALQAHVWLRCGNLIVTGGGPHRRFAPLTWFADTLAHLGSRPELDDLPSPATRDPTGRRLQSTASRARRVHQAAGARPIGRQDRCDPICTR